MDDGNNAPDWYSDEAATFGDRVAAAREALGMTDADLARRLGIKQKTVQAWEQDTAEPRANRLQMLSGVLNVSLRWLLTGEGPGLAAPEEQTMTTDVRELLTELRQVRGELTRNAERLGLIEKRLHVALSRSA